jgi:Fe-S cluster assembly scaffold protein SufB
MVVSLMPAGAYAEKNVDGWSEVEKYAKKLKKEYPEADLKRYIDDIDFAKEKYGRELTPKEIAVWKKGYGGSGSL